MSDVTSDVTNDVTEEKYDAELHVNEEPRNDFADVLIGFSVSFGFFFLVGLVATLIQLFN